MRTCKAYICVRRIYTVRGLSEIALPPSHGLPTASWRSKGGVGPQPNCPWLATNIGCNITKLKSAAIVGVDSVQLQYTMVYSNMNGYVYQHYTDCKATVQCRAQCAHIRL